MGLTSDKVFSALIALLMALAGTVFGWQWFHHGALWPALILVAILIIGLGCDRMAKLWLLPNRPIAAMSLLEVWILVPMSLGILVVAALVIATIHFKVAEKTGLAKEVTTGMMGAVSTFLSTLFVKSAEDADGNWSAAHIKGVFHDIYQDYAFTDPVGDRWVFSDTYGGVSGWGFKARRTRARNINNYIS